MLSFYLIMEVYYLLCLQEKVFVVDDVQKKDDFVFLIGHSTQNLTVETNVIQKIDLVSTYIRFYDLYYLVAMINYSTSFQIKFLC